MAIERIEVELTGTSPLLMHNIAGADLAKTTRKTLKTYDPKEDAEKAAYWLSNGKAKSGKKELCIPARCLYGCIRNASGYFKVKGRSMRPVIAGSVRIEEMEIPLGTSKYEIDIQSVVVQRARILRARPRLDNWKITFHMLYNTDYIDKADILRQMLEEAGVKVGLLDFRPANGGQYGTFEVTRFEPA